MPCDSNLSPSERHAVGIDEVPSVVEDNVSVVDKLPVVEGNMGELDGLKEDD